MSLGYRFGRENPRIKILLIFLPKRSFALKQLLIYELIGEEEEVGQWIKCLLNKHEHLYLDSQNPCEKTDMVTHISDLSPERDSQVLFLWYSLVKQPNKYQSQVQRFFFFLIFYFMQPLIWSVRFLIYWFIVLFCFDAPTLGTKNCLFTEVIYSGNSFVFWHCEVFPNLIYFCVHS